MNAQLTERLKQLGATLDDSRIAAVAQPQGNLYTPGTDYLVPLTHLSTLRVSGDDAADYLQNLLTNDARKLAPDTAALNALCNPKGRMLASFVMWREGADYCLSVSADLAEQTLKKLRMYVLRSKVSLGAESDSRIMLGLVGEGATRHLQQHNLLPAPEAFKVASGDATVIRLDAHRYQLIAPASDALHLIDTLPGAGFTLGATNVWDTLEVMAGLPLITARTQEAFVPQMVNFELLGGVNFKKGCYPGQEIVARTQYLGKLKKRLFRVFVAEGAPKAGDPVYGVDLADQSCGEIVLTSRVADGVEALAVLQMSSVEAGPLHLGTPAGPLMALRPLPYDIS